MAYLAGESNCVENTPSGTPEDTNSDFRTFLSSPIPESCMFYLLPKIAERSDDFGP